MCRTTFWWGPVTSWSFCWLPGNCSQALWLDVSHKYHLRSCRQLLSSCFFNVHRHLPLTFYQQIFLTQVLCFVLQKWIKNHSRNHYLTFRLDMSPKKDNIEQEMTPRTVNRRIYHVRFYFIMLLFKKMFYILSKSFPEELHPLEWISSLQQHGSVFKNEKKAVVLFIGITGVAPVSPVCNGR